MRMKHVNKIVAITCCLVLGVTLSTSTLAAGNVETRNWYKSKGTINYSNQAVFSSTDFDTLTAVWSRGTSNVANEIAKYSNTGSFSSVSALKNGNVVTSQMVIDDIERIARNTNCNASKIVYGKKAFAYDNGSNPKVYDGTYRADKIKDALVTKGGYTGEATSEEMTAFILANWYGSADMPNTSKTYHTHSTISNNETYTYINQSSPADETVYDWDPSRSSPGGCYTAFLPWYHQHSTSSTSYRSRNANTNYSDSSTATTYGGCFTYNPQYHNHSGSTTYGTGCYTTPWYHKHSTSSTSEKQSTSGGGPSNSDTNSTYGGCYTGDNVGHTKHGDGCKHTHSQAAGGCQAPLYKTGEHDWYLFKSVILDEDDPSHNYQDWYRCRYCKDEDWNNAGEPSSSGCDKVPNGNKVCNLGTYANCPHNGLFNAYKLNCNKSNSTVVEYSLGCDYKDKTTPYFLYAYVGCGKSSNVLQSKEWYVNCGRVKNQVMSVHINFEQD